MRYCIEVGRGMMAWCYGVGSGWICRCCLDFEMSILKCQTALQTPIFLHQIFPATGLWSLPHGTRDFLREGPSDNLSIHFVILCRTVFGRRVSIIACRQTKDTKPAVLYTVPKPEPKAQRRNLDK